jgi:hypothetical protein
LSQTHSTIEYVNGRSAEFVPGREPIVGIRLSCRIVIKLSEACPNVISVSAGRIVTAVARRRSESAEATYIAADDEAITMAFDRIDPARVVRGQPVRDVRSRAGQRNYSGLFWSVTTQDHLGYESLLERDRLLMADFDPRCGGWLVSPSGCAGLMGRRFAGTCPTSCSSTGMA